ncbi:MAG: YpdA family putative bacillithiol disulfide reductase [Vicinamibacterales bacterium]|jgi:thioredoxin reductase (NADPH)|nr:hypothetical protein [Acidobacteriota bacterium]MDP7294013.1 YpdA family putative bacillithiol disulfide reductase [Vicinamibacterales bacterium]MDP7472095.1 YpdA family putative bacillithiol disulfide reductase [Vicinamibacterales bacterium]MDP7671835.1 YpdA family putative bacillithiol disulfide reductase [Vicinamibacterales bacterium]HJO38649.1 YpdA family putative bacillithiol disulfide reductase [Vicinamibacterales bacterium]|tara:strand:- start:251 stop:1261 length:1011 start_codon:yes stop_codon:yes gene_type:complete
MSPRDVIIIGAGPAGLAAAIAAKQHGLDYTVLEKGVLVNSLFNFPKQMVFFTTPELLEIGGMPFVTPYDKPTRLESLRYYRRVADAHALSVELGEQVTAVHPPQASGTETFTVDIRSSEGAERQLDARTVVLAIGCYDHPNLLGIPGEDLPHVSHYYDEAHRYYRQRVVVVGGKNSAAEAALELYRAGAQVTLVHRHAELGRSIKYWVRPDIENRIAEGSIPARFETDVREIHPREVVVETRGRPEVLPADHVLLMTGYRTDSTLMRQAGVRLDPETFVPEHDAATLESNVPGFYIAGTALTGVHSGRIFIENGRFHGQVVIDAIAKRLAASHCTS